MAPRACLSPRSRLSKAVHAVWSGCWYDVGDGRRGGGPPAGAGGGVRGRVSSCASAAARPRCTFKSPTVAAPVAAAAVPGGGEAVGGAGGGARTGGAFLAGGRRYSAGACSPRPFPPPRGVPLALPMRSSTCRCGGRRRSCGPPLPRWAPCRAGMHTDTHGVLCPPPPLFPSLCYKHLASVPRLFVGSPALLHDVHGRGGRCFHPLRLCYPLCVTTASPLFPDCLLDLPVSCMTSMAVVASAPTSTPALPNVDSRRPAMVSIGRGQPSPPAQHSTDGRRRLVAGGATTAAATMGEVLRRPRVQKDARRVSLSPLAESVRRAGSTLQRKRAVRHSKRQRVPLTVPQPSCVRCVPQRHACLVLCTAAL